MKFADEFVESAHQVVTMVAMMQNITRKEVPLVFETSYGKVVLRVEPYEIPDVPDVPIEQLDKEKETAQPTPEVD